MSTTVLALLALLALSFSDIRTWTLPRLLEGHRGNGGAGVRNQLFPESLFDPLFPLMFVVCQLHLLGTGHHIRQ